MLGAQPIESKADPFHLFHGLPPGLCVHYLADVHNLGIGGPGPRTKLRLTRTSPDDWGRYCCRECRAFTEAWEQWRPQWWRAGRMGRPTVRLVPQQLHQAAAFVALWLGHLRVVPRGWELHLGEEGLADWEAVVRHLVPYFRRADADWGESGVVSARRWRDDVQYQAVRRLLADRLGINARTLRRRFGEACWWGPLVDARS